jgi:hypothetical protein
MTTVSKSRGGKQRLFRREDSQALWSRTDDQPRTWIRLFSGRQIDPDFNIAALLRRSLQNDFCLPAQERNLQDPAANLTFDRITVLVDFPLLRTN